MNEKIKNIIGIALVVAAIIFASSAWIFSKAYWKSSQPARAFSVNAEGSVVAVPDIAELTYSVITEGGKDLAALQRDNTDKANRINAYLKAQGVEDKDIKTFGYAINPRYQYTSCSVGSRVCPPAEMVGYSINHSVAIKVRNLSKVGEFLSGIVENGANSVYGPAFSIDDVEAVKNQAREEAIKNAKEKAKAIAEAARVRLGKIISIDESYYTPVYSARASGIGGDELVSVPSPEIEPGSQEIKVTVLIRYEIR